MSLNGKRPGGISQEPCEHSNSGNFWKESGHFLTSGLDPVINTDMNSHGCWTWTSSSLHRKETEAQRGQAMCSGHPVRTFSVQSGFELDNV